MKHYLLPKSGGAWHLAMLNVAVRFCAVLTLGQSSKVLQRDACNGLPAADGAEKTSNPLI